MAEQINIRELALEVLLQVDRDDVPIHLALRDMLEKYQFLPKTDRSFLKRLTEGTLEKQILIDYQIGQFSTTKLNKMRPLIRNLMRMSVYQILFLDKVPDSAAVNEAVAIAKKRGFRNLSGFVNGVLRNVSRNKENLKWPDQKDVVRYLSVTCSMPEFLVREFLEQYGRETAELLMKDFQKENPFYVRFCLTGNTEEKIRKSLEADGITVEKTPFGKYGYELRGVDYPYALESFREGWIQIQDISSQLVAECAGIKPGDTVLDLCAAPGGKSLYAAELLYENGKPSGQVISRDLTEYKCSLIEENRDRLGLTNMTIEVQDASEYDASLQEQADVVIADLPCSGYGVIGRKPDIRAHVSAQKEQELVQLQRAILKTAVRYLKPGGVLIYSTCTLNRGENGDNADWIREELGLVPESLNPYLPESLRSEETEAGRLQLIPGVHPCDGFFLARFRKQEG